MYARSTSNWRSPSCMLCILCSFLSILFGVRIDRADVSWKKTVLAEPTQPFTQRSEPRIIRCSTHSLFGILEMDVICYDLLVEVISHVSVADLRAAVQVNHFWLWAVETLPDFIWKRIFTNSTSRRRFPDLLTWRECCSRLLHNFIRA